VKRISNVKVFKWVDEDEIIGTVDIMYRGTMALYAWRKGGVWSLYTIEKGHILRIGTRKHDDLFDKANQPVV